MLGNTTKIFEWSTPKGKFACIPLIFSDIFAERAERIKMICEMISRIEELEQSGTRVPIVVSSYGSGLQTDFWRVPLQT